MENNNKYKNSKIYKIVSNVIDGVYYGSTTEPTLARRLAEHRAAYKRYLDGKGNYVSSFKLLETNDYDIVLVERVNCNSKEELHQKERFYIENNDCVNKIRRPIISSDEKRAYFKDYFQKNKEDLTKYIKQYNQINKEQIREKVNKPNICPCGVNHTTGNKLRHLKSVKHQSYIKDQETSKIKLSQHSFDFLFKCDSLMMIPKTYTNIAIIN